MATRAKILLGFGTCSCQSKHKRTCWLFIDKSYCQRTVHRLSLSPCPLASRSSVATDRPAVTGFPTERLGLHAETGSGFSIAQYGG